MKWVVREFSNSDEEIEENSEYFFKAQIDRAEKFGRRSRKSIIHDNLVNDQHDYLSIKQVVEVTARKGLRFYSAIPPLFLPLADSGMRPTQPSYIFGSSSNAFLPTELLTMCHSDDVLDVLNQFDATAEPSYSKFSEMIERISGNTMGKNYNHEAFYTSLLEAKSSLAGFSFDFGIQNRVETFMDELIQFSDFVRKRDRIGLSQFIHESKSLFKGTAGLGLQYFAFQK